MKYLAIFLIVLIATSQSYKFKLQNQINLAQLESNQYDQQKFDELTNQIQDCWKAVGYIRSALAHTYYLDGEIQNLFEQFDANDSNSIDIQELGKLLGYMTSQFGLEKPDGEDVINVMDELDLDQEGDIDQWELNLGVKYFFVDLVAGLGVGIGQAQAAQQRMSDALQQQIANGKNQGQGKNTSPVDSGSTPV